MAGLLADVLPYVYSRGNALRRHVSGLLADPIGSVEQTLGLLNDKRAEQENLLAQAYSDQRNPFTPTNQNALAKLIDQTMQGPMGFAPVGMIDAKALNAALGSHVTRLQGEADDWASRKYKANTGRVFFEGDGPTKGESMSIGGINANRRDRNVAQRLAQIDALERVGRVAQKNPALVESEFNEAKAVAEQIARRDGLNFDDVFDAMLGQRFTGTQEWMSGPGSIGRAIRNTVEPTISQQQRQATQAAPAADDWMSQLFGGQ